MYVSLKYCFKDIIKTSKETVVGHSPRLHLPTVIHITFFQNKALYGKWLVRLTQETRWTDGSESIAFIITYLT